MHTYSMPTYLVLRLKNKYRKTPSKDLMDRSLTDGAVRGMQPKYSIREKKQGSSSSICSSLVAHV